ncbi:MAG: response regulator transcription factor [Armatimonadota bacterium]|nr:response regulator transcription factor [Armatimonadota bacterium]
MQSTDHPIRVLLIEDQPIMSAALRQLLDSEDSLQVVGEAANGQDALDLAAREQPGIILLDLRTDEPILDFIPELLAVAQAARAIVLTGLPDLQLHRRAITQGALGLVLKEQPAQVLLQAIKRVHAGGVWIEGALLTSVLDELAQATQQMERPQTAAETALIAAITSRECEIIFLVCEGLKNKQIALRLRLSERTVHRHLSSIFHKLGVTDRLELTVFAYRTGLAQPTGAAASERAASERA